MASVKKRPDGQWRARYRDPAGKEHAKHFARKVDAQRWLDEVTASMVTAAYVDPKAGRVTFAGYFAGWAQRQVWESGTDRAVRLAAGSVTFGDVALASLRHSHVERWVKAMQTAPRGEGRSPGLAPSTIRTRVNNVRGVLRAAVRDRVIASDHFPNSSDPSDVYDEQPIHDVADVVHSHAHRSFGEPGADVLDLHTHEHQHKDGNSHIHDHGPVSSSGRRPGELHIRSQDWGEPTDLSSRLDSAAEQVADVQREMHRCHQALMDNEAELETADVLAARDELQRVWVRLSEQEAKAHSRLRAAQLAWKQVEADFTFGREGDHIRGAVADEPWERSWRRERESGLSDIDRDRF
jgi:hypothetical protein